MVYTKVFQRFKGWTYPCNLDRFVINFSRGLTWLRLVTTTGQIELDPGMTSAQQLTNVWQVFAEQIPRAYHRENRHLIPHGWFTDAQVLGKYIKLALYHLLSQTHIYRGWRVTLAFQLFLRHIYMRSYQATMLSS